MRKERETANKYRQQALEGDLMAMNNMGVCYAQGIGVVEESPIMARAEEECTPASIRNKHGKMVALRMNSTAL